MATPRKRSKQQLEADARAIAARFDELPDAQIVGIHVAAIIRNCAPCTIWRGIKAGSFPAPDIRGGKAGWRVGTLRGKAA